MTNSADPDQLASSEANWSGSTLFAKGLSGFSRTRVNKLKKFAKMMYPFSKTSKVLTSGVRDSTLWKQSCQPSGAYHSKLTGSRSKPICSSPLLVGMGMGMGDMIILKHNQTVTEHVISWTNVGRNKISVKLYLEFLVVYVTANYQKNYFLTCTLYLCTKTCCGYQLDLMKFRGLSARLL